MKTFKFFTVGFLLLVMSVAGISFIGTSRSDIKYKASNVSIVIKGTSSLHDWEMKSNDGKCDAVFVINKNNILTSLTDLKFNLLSKSLKSGQNMMDNNTYKALKVKEHETIAFVLTSASITPVDANNYKVKCIGKMTIAGTTKETELIANGKLNASDNTLTISGIEKMKMTDFNVKPPTVMMGTIKTGNDISISYSLKLTQ